MAIRIFPVTPDFAAEVGDVDLTRSSVGRGSVNAIKAAFWQYGVLAFPAQHLTSEQHVEFAQLFGPSRAEHPFLSGRRQAGPHRRENLRRVQPRPRAARY